ncbi:MAG: hypothetical protein GY781_13780 [Gammaproteobacteria bacterium]|nr:hypothetical protein [Gammaproteobacteria bacterium]
MDDTKLYEIKAAAFAAMGNFKKAIALKEDALEKIKQHLAAYQKKERWF